jgi:hypothetical protein
VSTCTRKRVSRRAHRTVRTVLYCSVPDTPPRPAATTRGTVPADSILRSYTLSVLADDMCRQKATAAKLLCLSELCRPNWGIVCKQLNVANALKVWLSCIQKTGLLNTLFLAAYYVLYAYSTLYVAKYAVYTLL